MWYTGGSARERGGLVGQGEGQSTGGGIHGADPSAAASRLAAIGKQTETLSYTSVVTGVKIVARYNII